MEYVYDHGTFADVPREYFIETMKKQYPHLFVTETNGTVLDAEGTDNLPQFRM
jgi:hypothetical protein